MNYFFFIFFIANQLPAIFTSPIVSAAMSLPVPFATSLLQQHVNVTFEGLPGYVPVPVNNVQIVRAQDADTVLQQQQQQQIIQVSDYTTN